MKQKDDSPLYLFESALEDREEGRKIIKRYKIPDYFQDDLFSMVTLISLFHHQLGEEKRPPFRWFLIGPKRSGTTVHIDPLATSAWNSSLHGHKLWILFPEDTPKDIVKGKKYLKKGKTKLTIVMQKVKNMKQLLISQR